MKSPPTSLSLQRQQIKQRFASSNGHLFYKLGNAIQGFLAWNACLFTSTISLLFFVAPFTWVAVTKADEVTTTTLTNGIVPTTLKLNPPDDIYQQQGTMLADDLVNQQTPIRLARPTPQSQPAQQPLGKAKPEATKDLQAADLRDCTSKTPENCPTYETWISTFTYLKRFTATDTPGASATGIYILGTEAAAVNFKPSQVKNKAAPPSIPPLKLGERFIDHPTDEWVRTYLPDNLRATAYQLPTDCADIPIILRHVWLAAHRRTETFGRWTIGDQAGKAATKRVSKVIRQVGTGNIATLVNPYSDPSGQPLLTFTDLEPLLHPGDMLVWAHFDRGLAAGHTHTISAVNRDNSGKIQSLTLLQGNQPLFDRQKTEIIKFLNIRDTKKIRAQLGAAPGRRIEIAGMYSNNLSDFKLSSKHGQSVPKVWKWRGKYFLVAAGPPKAASRPDLQRDSKVRQLSDWVSSINTARFDTITGIFEAMLLEARAMIEGGGTISADEAHRVGQIAGQRLSTLAQKYNDTDNQLHAKRLQEIREMLRAVQHSRPISTKGDTPQDDVTFKLWGTLQRIDKAFHLAATGSSNPGQGQGRDIPY